MPLGVCFLEGVALDPKKKAARDLNKENDSGTIQSYGATKHRSPLEAGSLGDSAHRKKK